MYPHHDLRNYDSFRLGDCPLRHLGHRHGDLDFFRSRFHGYV
jgi:hypothetical protein